MSTVLTFSNVQKTLNAKAGEATWLNTLCHQKVTRTDNTIKATVVYYLHLIEKYFTIALFVLPALLSYWPQKKFIQYQVNNSLSDESSASYNLEGIQKLSKHSVFIQDLAPAMSIPSKNEKTPLREAFDWFSLSAEFLQYFISKTPNKTALLDQVIHTVTTEDQNNKYCLMSICESSISALFFWKDLSAAQKTTFITKLINELFLHPCEGHFYLIEFITHNEKSLQTLLQEKEFVDQTANLLLANPALLKALFFPSQYDFVNKRCLDLLIKLIQSNPNLIPRTIEVLLQNQSHLLTLLQHEYPSFLKEFLKQFPTGQFPQFIEQMKNQLNCNFSLYLQDTDKTAIIAILFDKTPVDNQQQFLQYIVDKLIAQGSSSFKNTWCWDKQFKTLLVEKTTLAQKQSIKESCAFDIATLTSLL